MSAVAARARRWAGSDRADLVLAGALTAYAEATLWLGSDVPSRGAAMALVLLLTVPLAWRRRRPLGAACVVALGLAGLALLPEGSPEGGFVLFPLLVASYSVGAHADGRNAIAGLIVLFAGGTVNVAADPELVTAGDVVVADGFFVFFLGGGVWLLGRYVRSRQHEREQRAREAVTAERARIARELHDVIAHSVSVMGVQAAAAAEVLEREPGRARESLRSIQETAREAVLELRRLLAVTREGAQPPSLAPQPGLAQLETLVRQLRDAGLPVELTIEGQREPLSAGVDLSAYRILQEALTNALKHAQPTTARVTLRFGASELELVVENDGARASSGNGGGHGLIGMRERAELYGGSLEAGGSDDDGYRVRARLPLGSRS